MAQPTIQTAASATKIGVAQPPPKVFPPLDPSTFAPQLIWFAITFGFLLFALKRLLLPGIGNVIEAREQRIKGDLDEAGRLKGETEQALAAYEKALADAKSRAGAIAKSTRETVESEIARERAAVDKQIAAKLAEADGRIAATKTRALANIADIAGETATAIVAKLTGQTASKDEVGKALAAVARK